MKILSNAKFLIAIALLLILIIGFCIVQLILYSYDANRSDETYNSLRQEYYNNNDKIDAGNIIEVQKSEFKQTINNEEFFSSINDNCVGWVQIDNTEISYPVMQGQDNIHYLNYNINEKKSKRASILMDYRNRIDDSNVLIYGHNMKDGSMFHDINLYKDKDFFLSNNIINFDSMYESSKFIVFSAYIVNDIEHDVKVSFSDYEEFNNYLYKIKEKSMHKTDIDLSNCTNIITLTTCSYEKLNANFVIHAAYIN